MSESPIRLRGKGGGVVFQGTQSPGGGSRPVSYWVDCGVVDVADVAAAGALELVAYAEGRFVVGVRFGPDGCALPPDFTCWFITPNTTGFSGFGFITPGDVFDTPGVVADGDGSPPGGATGGKRQVVDVGPLIAGVNVSAAFLAAGAWQANHAYALNDSVIDSNGFVQVVSINGVSGGTEPVWDDTLGETTADGTAQWTSNFANPPAGNIHVYAEVVDTAFPSPPYPASLAFTTPPADGVAGATLAPIVVTVRDQNGDPYTLYDQTVGLEIVGVGTTNAGAGNASFKTTTAGVATFDDYAIADAGTYTLRARLYPTVVAPLIFAEPITIAPA